MAERATAAGVAADMKPPNYRGAVQRIRGIKAKKSRIAGINGEISGIYDTVEGYKVNKKAARIFLALDGLEADERQDIIRSLLGLIEVAEWDQGDLVDQAEGAGNVVAAQFRRAGATENDAGEDVELDETMREVEQPEEPAAGEEGEQEEPPVEEAAKPKSGRLSPAEARKRVAAHFGNGVAPPANDPPEPYSGDNEDLNPE